eukprot:gene4040-4324_t
MLYVIEEIENPNEEQLKEIGKFRYDLWVGETNVNHSLFPDGIWLEDIDRQARHWVARNSETKELLGVARLTIHPTIDDNPDGYLWIKNNLTDRLKSPVAHLCKLAVSSSARGLGIGQKLSEIRIEAAKLSGAQSVIVTASPANASILGKLGFIDTGIREIFPNRPTFEFYAMDLLLS